MTVDYPTDPNELFSLTEDEWQELLLRVSNARLAAQRPIVRLRMVSRNKRIDGYAILADLNTGMKMSDVANKHGCSVSMVSRIKSGQRGSFKTGS